MSRTVWRTLMSSDIATQVSCVIRPKTKGAPKPPGLRDVGLLRTTSKNIEVSLYPGCYDAPMILDVMSYRAFGLSDTSAYLDAMSHFNAS